MERVRFILDTNIISELSKPEPNRRLLKKFQQHRFVCATCAPVLHELRFGIAQLPAGKRRKMLTEFIDGLLADGIEALPYDQKAAEIHAHERATLTAKGKVPSYVDGQIAAIALACGAGVATRNTDDFKLFPGLRVDDWFR